MFMLYVSARNASNNAISIFMFHNFGIISLKLVTFVSVPVFFIFSPQYLINPIHVSGERFKVPYGQGKVHYVRDNVHYGQGKVHYGC
jgi:hypothetical protein